MDLKTGKLGGYVYSANCGWISLSNAVAYVQTDTIAPGLDTDADGLPDAWERLNFPGLGLATSPTADPDGDGMNNQEEYLAGTNPNNFSDSLRIIAITAPSPGTSVNLTWTSVSNRCYYVQDRLDSVRRECGLTAARERRRRSHHHRLVINTNAPIRFTASGFPTAM